MKKISAASIALLLSASIVSAGPVEKALEAIFDASGSDIFVKVALWFLLFTIFYLGASRVFADNNRTAIIVSLVIPLIAVRFMPAWWVTGFKSYLFIAAIVLIPYFVVQIVFQEPGWARRTAYALSMIMLWFLVAGVGGDIARLAFKGNEVVEWLFYILSAEWLFRLPFQWLFVIGIIIILLMTWLAKAFERK
ncbi:MAG: hypothetical protein ABIB71_02210 [Candidatus Woesearchaeota archaeon]